MVDVIALIKEVGREEGREEGHQEGIEQGQLEAKFETARNFLQMGLSIEQVAIGTGLSIEEVTQIQTQLDSDSE